MGTHWSKLRTKKSRVSHGYPVHPLVTIYKVVPSYRKNLAIKSYIEACRRHLIHYHSYASNQYSFGPDNAIYIGSYDNLGLFSGYGIQVRPNGSIYEGLFSEGFPMGKGVMVCSKGNVYFGDWKGDYLAGNGSIVYPSDGKIFEGELIRNVPNGAGSLKFADGASYTGTFQYGEKHGQGVYVWADGSQYVGEFRKGMVHGQGKYVNTRGRKYEGGWRMNKTHGYGRVEWPEGSSYEGFFVDGQREGWGELTKCEFSYCGFWLENLYDGIGVEVRGRGVRYGLWKLGYFVKKLVESPENEKIQTFLDQFTTGQINDLRGTKDSALNLDINGNKHSSKLELVMTKCKNSWFTEVPQKDSLGESICIKCQWVSNSSISDSLESDDFDSFDGNGPSLANLALILHERSPDRSQLNCTCTRLQAGLTKSLIYLRNAM